MNEICFLGCPKGVGKVGKVWDAECYSLCVVIIRKIIYVTQLSMQHLEVQQIVHVNRQIQQRLYKKPKLKLEVDRIKVNKQENSLSYKIFGL